MSQSRLQVLASVKEMKENDKEIPSKMSFSLSLWLKQCMVFGSVLLAIAITASSTSVKSQPSPTNPSPTTSASIVPSSTHPPSPTHSVSGSAPISVAQNTAANDPTPQEAVQVIRDYYNAIARRDYAQAYSAWGGNGAASQQSFEQFQQGFANVACVAVEVGEPGLPDAGAGSIYIEVPVTVTAITTNGTPQRFQGSYVLRRVNNVSGSTAQQRQWHIASANLSQVN